MEVEPVEGRPETASADDRVEVRLTIENGLVDADVDPVTLRPGQTVRWAVDGEDAALVTLRFEEREGDGRERGVRLAGTGLGPFAVDRLVPAPGRSGAGGAAHLKYSVLVDGVELTWPRHPVTGRTRDGGGIDVEVPPPGG